ncbi:MAG: hypothetical protein GX102_00025 [Porphyromonadaceae bacterium]|nr:hypothetical protein [Porphyromonadaceae bacterium]
MLKYDAFSNPTKKVKPVKIEIKDKDGKSFDGADIQIGMRPFERVSGSAKTIDFVGEDIIKKWKISAKKESESLYSKPVFVNPKNQIGSVVLTLQKQKVIKIFAKDNENGNYIPNFKIWLNDGKDYRENVNEIVFFNDDIDKTWIIEVSKNEGRVTYLGNIQYSPATGENPLYVECQKKSDPFSDNKPYKVEAGEHGKKTRSCKGYSKSNSGNDLGENCIVANKGYVFKNWELKNDTLVAQYEKKKSWYQNSKFIAGTITGALVLAVGIWFLYHSFGKEKQAKETPLTAQQITTYVEGDSLMLGKLESYMAIWEKQKPEIKTLAGIVWYNPTTWFVGSNESEPDSTDYKIWDEYKKSIDRAIEIRSLLNNLSFAELKNQEYVTAQQSFKAAIEKIDSAKYSEVGQKLGDVSRLTLTLIADSINAFFTPKEQENLEEQQESRMEESEIDPIQRAVRQPNQRQSATDSQTNSIERELQSATITKQKLKEYSEANFSNIAGSIQLYNEFWRLVGSNTQRKDDYDALLSKIKRDSILINSELRKFLDSICASSDDFEKFNVRGKVHSNSLSELKEIIK